VEQWAREAFFDAARNPLLLIDDFRNGGDESKKIARRERNWRTIARGPSLREGRHTNAKRVAPAPATDADKNPAHVDVLVWEILALIVGRERATGCFFGGSVLHTSSGPLSSDASLNPDTGTPVVDGLGRLHGRLILKTIQLSEVRGKPGEKPCGRRLHSSLYASGSDNICRMPRLNSCSVHAACSTTPFATKFHKLHDTAQPTRWERLPLARRGL